MRMRYRSLLAAVAAAALVPAGAAAARPPDPPAAAAGVQAARAGTVAARAGTVAAAPAGSRRDRARPARRSFVPGRVLVGFRPGVAAAGRAAVLRAVGARPGALHGRTQVAVIGRDADVRATARRLATQPGVAFAEPDWLRRPDACGPSVCWQLEASHGVNAATLHAAGTRGAGSVVAVVDTGVAPIADLSGQVLSRRTCAGLDDTTGITGVAPAAKVRAWKVDDGAGGIPTSSLVAALTEIVANPAFADVKVVNLSLGGPESSSAEQNAVEALLHDGRSVVASSGNDGNYLPQYPASYPGVLAVGATDAAGNVTTFSSYGKVDVVAPGQGVTVDDPSGSTRLVDGTSFASPIVAGVIALGPAAGSQAALRNRLGVEGTASTSTSHLAATDPKRSGHGLADAAAWIATQDSGAPAYLVAETSGPVADPVTAASSGQLANPGTTFDAYALKSDGSLGTNPSPASFDVDGSSAASGRSFTDLGGGVFHAASGPLPLSRGATHLGTATAAVGGGSASDTAPVRALRADDQAPGVALSGTGDDAWNRHGVLDGGGDGQVADDNVDDVYAVYLAAGDTLDATLRTQSGPGLAASLYVPGTTDVLSQFDRIVACAASPPDPFCPSTLHLRAPVAGTYLIDVYALGSEFGPTAGGYRLVWTVKNTAGVPVSVQVGACSPNGDGVQDRCAWSVGALSGYAAGSFVTSGFTSVLTVAGTGAKSWDGTARPDGAYTLRVLYSLGPGRRALLRTFPLTLDRVRPKVANLVVAPNPFEPMPRDGDRDTTTFAITSSERSRLRVLVYKYGTSTLLRTLSTGFQPAGRQRVSWNGRTLAGVQLRGRFAFRMQIIDPAGNAYVTGRYLVVIL